MKDGNEKDFTNPNGASKPSEEDLINKKVSQQEGQPSIIPPSASDSPLSNILPSGDNSGGDLGFLNTPADNERRGIFELLSNLQNNGQGNVNEAVNQAAGLMGGAPSNSSGDLPQIAVSQQQLNIPGNNNILKGNVSGKMIGNQPIFVEGGGITPISVLNNRRVAQQNAQIARKAERQKIFEAKPPKLKDARFQGSFNNQFNENQDKFVKAAQEQYGDDWDLALKDQTTDLGRKYVNSLANYDFLAKIGDQSTDKIAEVEAGIKSGDTVYSDQTRKMLDEYESLEGDFANGNASGLISLEGAYNKLEGGIALDKLLNDQSIDVKGTVKGYASIADNNDNWTTTTTKKTEYEKQLKTLAKSLANNQMKPSISRGITTEEDIFEHMKSLYGYESVTTKKVNAKPKDGSGRLTLDMMNYQEEQDKTLRASVTDENGNESFEDFKSHAYMPLSSNAKDSDFAGAKVFNSQGKTTKLQDGIKNVKPNGLTVTEVYNEETGKKELKTAIVAEITEEIENTNREGKITKSQNKRTVLIDYDSEEARARTDFLTPEVADEFRKKSNSTIKNYKDPNTVLSESASKGESR